MTPDTKEWTAKIGTSRIQTIPNVRLLVHVRTVERVGTRPVVVWMDMRGFFVTLRRWNAIVRRVSTEERAKMKLGRTDVNVSRVSTALNELVGILFCSFSTHSFHCVSVMISVKRYGELFFPISVFMKLAAILDFMPLTKETYNFKTTFSNSWYSEKVHTHIEDI